MDQNGNNGGFLDGLMKVLADPMFAKFMMSTGAGMMGQRTFGQAVANGMQSGTKGLMDEMDKRSELKAKQDERKQNIQDKIDLMTQEQQYKQDAAKRQAEGLTNAIGGLLGPAPADNATDAEKKAYSERKQQLDMLAATAQYVPDPTSMINTILKSVGGRDGKQRDTFTPIIGPNGVQVGQFNSTTGRKEYFPTQMIDGVPHGYDEAGKLVPATVQGGAGANQQPSNPNPTAQTAPQTPTSNNGQQNYFAPPPRAAAQTPAAQTPAAPPPRAAAQTPAAQTPSRQDLGEDPNDPMPGPGSSNTEREAWKRRNETRARIAQEQRAAAQETTNRTAQKNAAMDIDLFKRDADTLEKNYGSYTATRSAMGNLEQIYNLAINTPSGLISGNAFSRAVRQILGDDEINKIMQMSQEAAIGYLGGKLGAGISNADRDIILTTIFNPTNTPDVNASVLANLMRNKYREVIALQDNANNFSKKYSGRLPSSINLDELNQYLKKIKIGDRVYDVDYFNPATKAVIIKGDNKIQYLR